MPKIQVNETDLSWYYRQRDPGQLVVLMPGVSTFGPHTPTLTDESNFAKTFGGPISVYDTSYQMALSFVKTGISVLYWRQELPGEETASATIKTETSSTYVAPTDPDVIVGDDPISGSTGPSTAFITFAAKYPGSFGKKLSLKYDYAGENYRRIIVMVDTKPVETLFFNFDPSTQYYYKTVIGESSYVTISSSQGNLASIKPDTIEFKGGKDGDPANLDSKEHLISAVVTALKNEITSGRTINGEKVNMFDELSDPYLYDFNIAISAGFSGASPDASTTTSDIDGAFVALCEKKGTAIYFVDGAEDMDADQFYTYTGLPSTSPDPSQAGVGFNTSYAAATGPWMNSVLVSNGVTASLPGSYAQLISWGQSLANGTPLWMAPAGVKRASLNGIVKSGSNYEVGAAILDMWQNHDVIKDPITEHGVNPIMNLKQYGYVIYGNSTLLQTRYDAYGGVTTSMLQSLSTRVVANMIKTQAFLISLQLQFDQIDDDLFAEFRTLMTVYMDQLKYGGALYDYEIIVDRSYMTLDDLNSRTVPVLIRISPNPAAENFIINLEISQAGVTFGGDSTDDTVTE